MLLQSKFLSISKVVEAEVTLVGAPILIMEAHFEGLGNEKLSNSSLALIPLCPFQGSFQFNLFSFTKSLLKEFVADADTLLITHYENCPSFSAFVQTRKILLTSFLKAFYGLILFGANARTPLACG